MRYGPEDVNGVIAELESSAVERPGMQRRRIWATRLDRAVEAMTVELEALATVRELHQPEGVGGAFAGGACGHCRDLDGDPVEWPCETALLAGVGPEEG